MSHEDTPLKGLPSSVLVQRAAAGWTHRHSGAAQELVNRWGAQFSSPTDVKYIDDNIIHFISGFSRICLRGLSHVPCILLADGGIAGAEELRKKILTPHSLPFILTTSESADEKARRLFPRERCLILSPEQLKHLLKSEAPNELLKGYIQQHIPKSKLMPYNLLLPAEGSMFFGRKKELDRLIQEEETSFALAGPSRVGKTSLIKHYKNEMSRRRDYNSHARFFVSFYDCADTTSDGTARFLAMAIDPSKRSSRVTTGELLGFLHYKSNVLGRTLDLLLDEVDLVCQNEAFKQLGAAAKAGFCRLILCGKGVLLKSILTPGSSLECRLELIQLEPLDKHSARELFLRPLYDMGFEVVDPDRVAGEVLRWTGQLPYLLQFYGRRIARLAIEETRNQISVEQVETLKSDFVIAQYFVKPLNDLEDPETRLVGLSLLKHGHQKFTIPYVQQIISDIGLGLCHQRVFEICNELVINNVLIWRDNAYAISNEGIYFYANELGYLSSAYEEARRLAKPRA